MSDTQIAEQLYDSYRAAARRVAAARGRLTRACKDGSDVKIDAAIAWLRELQAEAAAALDTLNRHRYGHGGEASSDSSSLPLRCQGWIWRGC